MLRLNCGERQPFFMALEDPQALLLWLCVLRSGHARLVDGSAGLGRAATASAEELVGRARAELVVRPRRAGKGTVDGFFGAQLIDWLMASQDLESREDAVAVANEMLVLRTFRHATIEGLSSIIDGPDVYVWNR